jgi:pyridoxal phosphate enzyme (YggS family)
MISYTEFEGNMKRLEDRVEAAAGRAGRRFEAIRILPVTKTFPIDAVRYCQQYGVASVGENRVQEVVDKQSTFRRAVRWELIGHLQSNKVKPAISHFDCIQSVDSEKLLTKLQRAAAALGVRMPILLQVNAGEDPAKHGLDCGLVDATVAAALQCDNLELRGLMTIAPLSEDVRVARATFSRLRNIQESINSQFGLSLKELSMGMSGDLEVAIEEGSTCIRVGSALFGERPQ